MAHKETLQNDELKASMPGIGTVYTVSSSVGYGCRNMREDVRLVQFYINAIAGDWAENWENRPKRLETDGLFGGKTWAAVKNFQKWANSAVDGAISPIDGRRLVGPNKGLVYTMYYLNYNYWMSRPQWTEDLRKDPELPEQLREYLGKPLQNLS